MEENQRFKLRVKAHLSSSSVQVDSYFAVDKNTKQNVIVKGPFLKRHHVQNVLAMRNIKKMLGLPYIDVKEIYLIPNLFTSTTRSECKEGKLYPFLVYEDVCFSRDNKMDIPLKEISENDNKIFIVDPKRFVKLNREQTKCIYAVPVVVAKKKRAMLMYFLIMSFRHALNISDSMFYGNQITNFLYDIENYVVYVTGEEKISSKPAKKFWTKLSEEDRTILLNFVDKNWKSIDTLLELLSNKISENKKRISKILTKERYENFHHNVVSLRKKDKFKELI